MNPEKRIPGNGIGILHAVFQNRNRPFIIAVFQIVRSHPAADPSGHSPFIPAGFLRIDIPLLVLDRYFALISAFVDIGTVIVGADPSGLPRPENLSIIHAVSNFRDDGFLSAFSIQNHTFTKACNASGAIIPKAFYHNLCPVHAVFNKTAVNPGYAAGIAVRSLYPSSRLAVSNRTVVYHAEHSHAVLVHLPHKRRGLKGKTVHLSLPFDADKHSIAGICKPGNRMAVSIKSPAVI